MQLPDMQPALAAEIVAFRERITAFSSVYELLYVDGMTEAYFTEIRDSVQIYGDIARNNAFLSKLHTLTIL